MKLLIFLYGLLLVLLTVYSYGFVDPNIPFSTSLIYQKLHYLLLAPPFYNRVLSTTIFVIIVSLLFAFYFLILWLAKRGKLTIKQLKWLIGLSIVILFFSYPAFSYDIFNYILTAKVTFLYRENPYIVMPIELVGEPNLAFTHAANKIALYGPSWILLTFIPHTLGVNNILLTIFSFKLLVLTFYLTTVWLVFKITKNVYSLAFFSLNPLVVIETLVSSHNDIVMMFFALLSFYLLRRQNFFLSIAALVVSVLIKYATIFLIPVYVYLLYLLIMKKKILWEKIWRYSALAMFFIFLLSSLREELYPWYFIWPLTFLALENKFTMLTALALGFSFGLSFRFAPFIYTISWTGITPIIKKLVSFVPPLFAVILYVLKKKI